VSLLSVSQSITSNTDAITNADRTIRESTESLQKLKDGTDPLDIASAELTVKQRKNALYDAQEKLSDYTLRAPFGGTIAKLNLKKGDVAGTGSAAATIITKEKIAQIALNEVDAAKIHAGQKATLTFDAIDGLSIAAEVGEVDTIGTVSQGVVSYNVKLSFQTQDERVKSGMSVTASIVTGVTQDVVAVPSSAIKTKGDISYIEVLPGVTAPTSQTGIVSKVKPTQITITTGATNGTLTEITDGITDGALIITRTISGGSKPASASAPSLFGGGNRGGGVPRN
jgi:RND family efflux transporter MFP subunit